MASNSPRKPKGDRVADSRARARQMQEQQLRKERRKRTVTIWSLVAVAVLVVAVVVAFTVARGGQSIPDQGPAAVVANREGGVTMDGETTLAEPEQALGGQVDAAAVEVPEQADDAQPASVPEADAPAAGDPTRIVVYADFNCTHCADFEQSNGDYLQSLLAEGEATVEYRMIGFLDNPGTGNYSSRAAAASLCVAQEAPEAYNTFVSDVFATYPQKQGAGLSNEELIDIADAAGADVASCVEEDTYRPQVKYTTAKAQAAGVRGTPTVFVNGENWALEGQDQTFQDFVESQREAQ